MSTAPAIEVGTRKSSVEVTLERFRGLFNSLDAGNLSKLSSVYSDTVQFQDPLSSVSGLDELNRYFAGAYANVVSCTFEFGDPVITGENAAITWVMHLRHKRIRRGREIRVHGMSRLVIQDGKVTHHRDYFDAGQLLYEHLPVIGRFIRWIRIHAA
ncbi:nuclear transport factor 2 family protein [Marinobacter sp. NP-4(2019)]|uniref:nuclear transport factor 2 family protein n=1 Tax=Marinobacter sp. NP-4(2019) TaxID=2488665 RepID=UPI000FC3CD27|nr:nuclear transport factor 2 family protein [Marinobacter sp. NP-4(2019)]AZT83985.1 nuclear transport factor 2 family protein [Marinobacter sp. NP-4(2019)]